MFIEQIIEFEWRRLGPPNRTFTPVTAYFYEKTKIFKENLRIYNYLLLRYYRRQYALLPSTRAKTLTKLSNKL